MFNFFLGHKRVVHFKLLSAERDEVDTAVVVFRQSVIFTKFIIAMFAINAVNASFLTALSATSHNFNLLARQRPLLTHALACFFLLNFNLRFFFWGLE